jgi:hypothetical protein
MLRGFKEPYAVITGPLHNESFKHGQHVDKKRPTQIAYGGTGRDD